MDPSEKPKKRKGERHNLNRRILFDQAAVAFPGWQSVNGDWTLNTCKKYVEWCHIDKLFPYHRHKQHIRQNIANLHYCTFDAFVQRCIEVYRCLYQKPKLDRSEVGLGLCQMVYAEMVLFRTVDWRTFKRSPKVTVPTSRDIPRAGRSDFPREGLGPKKNIVQGVSNDLYEWSDPPSSDSESDDDDFPQDPMDEPMPTPTASAIIEEEEEKKEERERRDMVLYVEPLASKSPTRVPVEGDEELHAYIRDREMELRDSDRYEDEPTEEEFNEAQGLLMIMPPSADSPEMNPELEDDSSMKEAKLKLILQELKEKKQECELLKRQLQTNIQEEDVRSLEKLIEVAQIHLSRQQSQMEDLEAFYLRLKNRQDGGSSSSTNPIFDGPMQKIIKACDMEEARVNEERRRVQEAQLKLNFMEDIKDQSPIDQAVALYAFDVPDVDVDEDMQQQISTSQVQDLKKMLRSFKRLEDRIEKKKKSLEDRILNGKTMKKWIIQTKPHRNPIVALHYKWEQREARLEMEEARKRKEEGGHRDVA